jgi:hypothetical protein
MKKTLLALLIVSSFFGSAFSVAEVTTRPEITGTPNNDIGSTYGGVPYGNYSNWDTAVASVPQTTSIHTHDIGDDSCLVSECQTDDTLISINECVTHIQGPKNEYPTLNCVDPWQFGADDAVFVGYSTPSAPGVAGSGLAIQGTEFTSVQKRRVVPLARIQAKIGASGPPYEISDRGVLDLRAIGSEFEYRFFRWIKEAIGSLFVRGGLITETVGSPRNLSISTGTFYDGEIFEQVFPAYQNISGIVLLRSSFGNWSTQKPISVLQIDNINIDSPTGLTTITGNRWTSTSIIMSPEGVGVRDKPRFFLVYAQNEHLTQSAAENEGINFGPFTDQATSRLIPVASVIIQKNSANIASVIDRRPRTGASGGAISGATDLQSAYNSSVIPQITTDVTRGALTIKDGGSGVIQKWQDSTGRDVFAITSGFKPFGDYVLVQDRKTKGTHGGGASATTWNQRDINTIVVDTTGQASISTNTLSLPWGIWRYRIFAPGYEVGRHRLRLFDATANGVVPYGEGPNSYVNGSNDGLALAFHEGKFSIPCCSSNDYEIDHWTELGRANFGLGLFINVTTEVYFQGVFTREAN